MKIDGLRLRTGCCVHESESVGELLDLLCKKFPARWMSGHSHVGDDSRGVSAPDQQTRTRAGNASDQRDDRQAERHGYDEQNAGVNDDFSQGKRDVT